jgi:lambda repressor-like predicted transcriptional regulator
MDYRDFHPEDVKAAIRKRFETLTLFEEKHGLAHNAVTDMLRGRTSARTAKVVNAVLAIESASIAPKLSGQADDNRKSRSAHRLNAQAA